MAIEETKSRYERARVLYFDSRRGEGYCLTQAGKKARIPLSAVNEANLITLDEGDEIQVCIDEHNRNRIDRLRLPEPAAAPEPPPRPFDPHAHKSRSVRKR
jgi:cold shock CspA family protein